MNLRIKRVCNNSRVKPYTRLILDDERSNLDIMKINFTDSKFHLWLNENYTGCLIIDIYNYLHSHGFSDSLHTIAPNTMFFLSSCHKNHYRHLI